MSFKGILVKSDVEDKDKPGFATQFKPVWNFLTSNEEM